MAELRIVPGNINKRADKHAETWGEPYANLLKEADPSYFDASKPSAVAQGYTIAVPDEDAFIGALVFEANTRNIVGGHVRGTDWVDPEHRGQGLGKEIARAVLDASNWRGQVKRGTPAAFSYTTANYHAHVKAHRWAVADALAAGEDVRPEVLEDHPDLQEELTPSPG